MSGDSYSRYLTFVEQSLRLWCFPPAAIIDSVQTEASRTRRAVRAQSGSGVAGAARGAAVQGAGPLGPGRPGMRRRNSNVEQEVDHRSSVTMEGNATVYRSRTPTRNRAVSD